MTLSVPVTVNGRLAQEASVRVGLGGECEVPVALLRDLAEARLDRASAARRQLEERLSGAGGDWLGCDAASVDGFAVSFDQSAVALRIALPLSEAAASTIRLTDRAPPAAIGARVRPAWLSVGSFVRAEMQGTARGGDAFAADLPRVTTETFAGLNGALWGTLAARVDWDPNRARDALRVTNRRYVRDWPEPGLRLTAGEVVAPAASLQTAAPIRGISLSTQYAVLQPFRTLTPTGRSSFVLEEDADVAFYANGTLVDEVRLAAGRYDASDFPLIDGRNELLVVAEGAFGRQEVLNTTLFFGGGLLDPGITDFGASLGRPEDGGRALLATGFWRRGVTQTLTLGANVQAAGSRAQLGAEAQVATPLGQLRGDLAANASAGGGLIGAVQLQRTDEIGGAVLTTNLLYDYRDPGFRAPALRRAASPRNRFAADLALSAGGWNVAAGLLAQDGVGSADSVNANLRVNRRLGRAALSVGATYLERDGEDAEIGGLFSLSLPFGQGGSAATAYRTTGDQITASVRQASPRDLGDFALAASALRSDLREQARLDAAYLHNRFDLDATLTTTRNIRVDRRDTQARMVLSTFVGLAGGRAAIGRPLAGGDAFLIAKRHASIGDKPLALHGAVGDRVLARGGAFGPALVTLNAYRPAPHRVAVADLPLGYARTNDLFAETPQFGQGYVLEFGSARWRTLLGRLVTPEGEPVASVIGVVCQDGVATDFFTNAGGRFAMNGMSFSPARVLIADREVGGFTIEGADAESGLARIDDVVLRTNARGQPESDAPPGRCGGGGDGGGGGGPGAG